MKIYTITQGSQGRGGYDEYDGHVIVANNEDEVRALAMDVCANEGQIAWEDGEVEEHGQYTGTATEPFILLSDFCAG